MTGARGGGTAAGARDRRKDGGRGEGRNGGRAKACRHATGPGRRGSCRWTRRRSREARCRIAREEGEPAAGEGWLHRGRTRPVGRPERDVAGSGNSNSMPGRPRRRPPDRPLGRRQAGSPRSAKRRLSIMAMSPNSFRSTTRTNDFWKNRGPGSCRKCKALRL